MKVEDVMTRDVKTVERGTTLKEAAVLLAELHVSGLPVVENDRVVGVVSEADILFKERAGRPEDIGLAGLMLALELGTVSVDAKLHARTAGEAMTAPAITIGSSRPLAEAAASMLDHRISRLPVVDDGRLVGIVTRADLVRAFIRPDEDIAREIKDDVIVRSLWISPEEIDVEVEDGEVTIGGRVDTKADAELIPSFAERVPGVVSVASTLSWRSTD
jgi:CBS domain-containing protein